MSERYSIKVNDSIEFNFDKNDSEQFDSIPLTKNHFHILHQNSSCEAEVVESDFIHKKYTVKINGTTYEVAIHNGLDNLISEMGFEVGARKVINALHAPMPGLILEITAHVGQEVLKNDPLLILGAMKMENSYLSPRDGIIKSISVAQGDAVEKGQLLIEFE